jgi:hypothetical protein
MGHSIMGQYHKFLPSFLILQQTLIFFLIYFPKYKGESMAHNKDLADKQRVSKLDREIIDKLHILRELIEANTKHLMSLMKNNVSTMEKLSTEEFTKTIQTNYKVWIENEKLLQKLWKFSGDEGYIRTWYFPACSCPKMDNDDAWPHGPYIKSKSCIIHGWEE